MLSRDLINGESVEQTTGSMADLLWCSVNIQLIAPPLSRAITSFILEHRHAVCTGD